MRDDNFLLPGTRKVANDGLKRGCGCLKGQVIEVHSRELESSTRMQ